MLKTICLTALMLSAISASAQEWMKIHVQDEQFDGSWTFPYTLEHISHYDFSDDESVIRLHRIDETNESTTYIPFAVEMLDSITFDNSPDSYGKNKYTVFAMNITIENFDTLVCYYNNPLYPNENGARQDWYNCYVSVDGRGQYPDYSGTARVRGRGNSSWRWYPKKPMKIKLDTKNKMLGMGRNRDWVLLANYRDVTDIMNTYAFICAQQMGIPYTTSIRYIEVFVNGQYQGLYQMTEQVEQGSHRVDVADSGGLLLTIDTDDGDNTWKYNTDTMCFWSKVYNLPIGIKYPEVADLAERNRIRDEFAELEYALKDGIYDRLDSLLDIPTFISLMQLNDLTYNNDFPNRSIFLSRDVGGRWKFGPAWDYDAGYAFTGNQYTSHQFFSQTGSMKVSPASTRYYYNAMFRSGKYTRRYIEQWNSYKDSLLTVCWDETMRYVDGMRTKTGELSAQERDLLRWPMSDNYGERNPVEETKKMHDWLQRRIDYMTTQINNFEIPSFDDEEYNPEPEPEPEPSEYTDFYGYPSGLNTDKLTRVGTQSITIEYDLSAVRSMSKQRIQLDLDKILSAFAETDLTDVNQLTFMAYDNLATHDLTQHLSSSDGYYMNWEGQACLWQAEIMQCKIGWNASGCNLTFAYTGTATSTDHCTASVFLVYDSKYMLELKMDITFTGSQWGGWGW